MTGLADPKGRKLSNIRTQSAGSCVVYSGPCHWFNSIHHLLFAGAHGSHWKVCTYQIPYTEFLTVGHREISATNLEHTIF